MFFYVNVYIQLCLVVGKEVIIPIHFLIINLYYIILMSLCLSNSLLTSIYICIEVTTFPSIIVKQL